MLDGLKYRELAARLIRDGEGVVKCGRAHVVYDDATGKPLKRGDIIKGHPTIGYGRHLSVRGISDDEVDALLAADLPVDEEIARGFIGGQVWLALGDARRAVLIDMAHNMGPTRLYGFVKLRAAIQRQDWRAAAAEIEDSAYCRQVGRRCTRNCTIMLTGKIEEWGE